MNMGARMLWSTRRNGTVPDGRKRLVRAGVNPTTQMCVAHVH